MIAPAITSAAQTADSRPTEKPDSTVVAGPVTVESATSFTGLYFVSVKYCVRIWMMEASTSPIATAIPGRQLSMYVIEMPSTTIAEMIAETKKPRLIDFMPCSSSERGVTAMMPMIDVIDADGAHEQREHHARDRADLAVGERRRAQDQGGHQGHLVALEQVGRHAGAVADVVADVVGDRGGVARVVLRDAHLHLADEVGADVGGLREDAATDPHEHREQRAAEAEAHQHSRRVALEDHQDQRRAEQAEADREHAGHPTGAERDRERLAQARFLCGVGGAHVGAHGEPHARVAREHRGARRRAGTRSSART